MGTGCKDCNNNSWNKPTTPDTQISYTGDPIPELGICTGDLLSEIEAVLLDKVLEFMEGNEIIMSSLTLTQCNYIRQFIQAGNDDKSLINTIDIILKAICQLNADITSVKNNVSTITDAVYDLKCLTVSSPTVNNIIQALIDENCIQRDAINNLFNDINNPTLSPSLESQIKEIVNQKVLSILTSCGSSGGYTYGMSKTLSGDATSVRIEAMVPPYCPIPCFAGLDNFDSTGKGLGGFCGWYICNGLNGTPDMRGYTFSGMTNAPGGTLDDRVNPSVLGDPQYASNTYDKKGEVAIKLVDSNLPPHRHYFHPDSHQHFFNFYNFSFKAGTGQNGMCKYPGGGAGPDSMQTSTAVTGSGHTDYSGGNSGGGVDSHLNIQPTIYGLWIMRKN